ncbi:hypothetical protein BC332_25110 [Capsicum chinense]|nr:hypothetical protein BC332_25110 [Capsicum chinense]
MNKVMLGWAWTTNATTSIRGRIWVAWNLDEVLYTVLETTEQYIRGKYSSHNSGVSFLLTTVYGRHTIAARQPLWSVLRAIHTQVQEPWLIMGDFNSILTSENREMGNPVQEYEIRDFREFTEECNISEMPAVGRSFTWTNEHVYNRIDKVLGPRGIWQNLKGIRQEIQLLNKREYLGVTEKVRSIRKDLLEKQSLMTNAPIPTEVFDEDKELQLQLNKWRHIEKSIYRQKAREQWIKLGDSNTSYFFAHMKGRKIQNQIKVLTIADDVEAAFKGIADDKAPGIDGFNSHFFKQSWTIIGQ